MGVRGEPGEGVYCVWCVRGEPGGEGGREGGGQLLQLRLQGNLH